MDGRVGGVELRWRWKWVSGWVSGWDVGMVGQNQQNTFEGVEVVCVVGK